MHTDLIALMNEAERLTIPRVAEHGRLKGYNLYGKISVNEREINASTLPISIDSKEKQGIFATFDLYVMEWQDKTNLKLDLIYQQNVKKKQETNPDHIYPVRGTFLVYIEPQFLGKDVCIRLGGKTSIARQQYKGAAELSEEEVAEKSKQGILDVNNRATIFSFQKDKRGSWHIVPLTKISVITSSLLGKDRLRVYMSLNAGNTVRYVTDTESTAYKSLDWKEGHPVSSAAIQLPLEKYYKADYSWEYRDSLDLTLGKPTKTFNQACKVISSQLTLLRKYTRNMRKVLQENLLSAQDIKLLQREFSNSISENWDTYFEPAKSGKYYGYSLIDRAKEQCTRTKKDDALQMLEAMKRRIRKEQGGPSIAFVTKNYSALFTAMYFAIIGNVSIYRLMDNYDRVSKNGYSEQEWITLLIYNPYYLTLLGGALSYRDCLSLEAVVCGNLPDDILQRKISKEDLYVLTKYRDYTKQSSFRDTLVTLAEIPDVADELHTNILAEKIWNNVSFRHLHITFGNSVKYKPVEDAKPLFRGLKPMEHQPVDYERVNSAISRGFFLKCTNDYLIPLYECVLEIKFMEFLYKNAVLSKDIKNTVAKYQKGVLSCCSRQVLEKEVKQLLVDIPENRQVVIIGDNYIQTERKVKYQHKPPYTEPVYIPEKIVPKKKSAKVKCAYIVENVETYSLWELYTLVMKFRPDDSVYFLFDLESKPARRGIYLGNVLSQILPTKKAYPTKTDFKQSDIVKDMMVLTETDTRYWPLTTGKKNSKRIKLSSATTQVESAIIDVYEQYVKKQGYKPEEILIVTTDSTYLNLNPQLAQIDMESKENTRKHYCYTLGSDKYYSGSVLRYTGITDMEKPRYRIKGLHAKGIELETLETKGICKRHELSLTVLADPSRVIIDNVPMKKSSKTDALILTTMYDSLLDEQVCMIWPVKKSPHTMEITGENTKHLTYGYAIPFDEIGSREYKCVICYVNGKESDLILTRDMVYTILSKATEQVCLIGDVPEPRGRTLKTPKGDETDTALDKARTRISQKNGRTLCKLLVEGGL